MLGVLNRGTSVLCVLITSALFSMSKKSILRSTTYLCMYVYDFYGFIKKKEFPKITANCVSLRTHLGDLIFLVNSQDCDLLFAFLNMESLPNLQRGLFLKGRICY